MPRKARIDAPGALHHLIVKGIEKKLVFKDQVDRFRFLDRLEEILVETATPCYAWALMPNHMHLLFRTGLIPIATIMRRLLTFYAQYFNRRYNRHGQLFQNRYKSILCEEESYFLELVRYIHLNPLRGKLVADVKSLETYPFCGHSALIGKVERNWQDTKHVLGLFGKNLPTARQRYTEFLAHGVNLGPQPELVGGGVVRSTGGWEALKSLRTSGKRIKGDERILGGSDFVQRVLKKANEEFEQKSRLALSGLDMDALLKIVTQHYQIDSEELQSATKARTVSHARGLFCYLAVVKLRSSCVQVGRFLNLSPSTVSKASARGRSASDRKELEHILQEFLADKESRSTNI